MSIVRIALANIRRADSPDESIPLAQSALTVNVLACGFTNNNEGIVLANANDADLTFDLNGNRFFNNLATGASGSAIVVANATTVTPTAIGSGRVRNNIITVITTMHMKNQKKVTTQRSHLVKMKAR